MGMLKVVVVVVIFASLPASLPALYTDPKDFVLISIFKTSLEVPSVILQLGLCWDTEERQDGGRKNFGKRDKTEV